MCLPLADCSLVSRPHPPGTRVGWSSTSAMHVSLPKYSCLLVVVTNVVSVAIPVDYCHAVSDGESNSTSCSLVLSSSSRVQESDGHETRQVDDRLNPTSNVANFVQLGTYHLHSRGGFLLEGEILEIHSGGKVCP